MEERPPNGGSSKSSVRALKRAGIAFRSVTESMAVAHVTELSGFNAVGLPSSFSGASSSVLADPRGSTKYLHTL